MKKNILFKSVAASALLFGACDYNDKFDGLDASSRPSDVISKDYTLTAADYTAIANNNANKAIAEGLDISAALASVGSRQAFSTIATASTFVPAFLSSNYLTVDNGSVMRLTYNKTTATPDHVSKLEAGKLYTVSEAAYATVWGEGSTTNFFTPSVTANANMNAILKGTFTEAVSGDIVGVTYNYSENEPSGSVVSLNEDFNHITASMNPAVTTGWSQVALEGTFAWNGRVFSGNGYVQASANGAAGAVDVYMVSPQLTISADQFLTFSATYGYYMAQGGRLDVLVSSNLSMANPSQVTAAEISAATWDNLTDNFEIEIPTGNFGTLANAGEASLSKYVGKKVYVAFRYHGNGPSSATTTVQIDDVIVKSEAAGGGGDTFIATSGLYSYSGTAWAAYTANNSYMLTKADFTTMGSNLDNFSSSMSPDFYLPIFLKSKYPYAVEGREMTIAYKWFASSVTSLRADVYTLTEGEWVKNQNIEVITDQFVKQEGKWLYNPSVTLNLVPVRNDPFVTPFYQAIVDWVWDNVDVPNGIAAKGQGYVTTFGNNEYYTGVSAYYNNIDIRPAAARGQYPAGFEGLSDEVVKDLMIERLLSTTEVVLGTLYPEVDVIQGIETIYTIRAAIYEGSTVSAPTHSFKYKVVGSAKFEYIKDSYQRL